MRDAGGRLFRTWKDGEARIPAFLEDEASLALALLDLAEADPDEAAKARWGAEARRTVDGFRRSFGRGGGAGLSFTGERHERLYAPTRDLFDKAVPSAPAAAARAMARLARRERDAALAAEAFAAVEEVSGLMARAPRGTESWHLAWEELRTGGLLRPQAPAAAAAPGEQDEEETDDDGSSASDAEDPVRVTASLSSSSVGPGGRLEVLIAVEIAEGWTLTGQTPLAVDAWGGPGLRLAAAELPPAGAVRHEDGTTEPGLAGRVEVRLAFEVRTEAASGEHPLAVSLRYRACGEGSCLPERALALTVPVLVRGS